MLVYNRYFRFFIVFYILNFTFLFPLFSQNQASKWYFGNTGLDFSTAMPTLITNSAMSSFEGSASMCDANGNLLFYTDGVTVWNKNNQIMPNGNGIWGDASTTQFVAVPIPQSSSKYLLFTPPSQADTAGNVSTGPCHGCLAYSAIDMSLANGNGDVVVTEKNIPLYHRATEKVTAIRHANGCDIWVVSHEYGNNAFYVYKVTEQGLNTTPVITNIGINHSIYQGLGASGYMKASKNGTKIACAIEAHHTIEVFDFDKNTGVLSNTITLTDSQYVNTQNYYREGQTYQPYGVEFSPDGKLLYVGLVTYPYKLFQYNINLPTQDDVWASRILIDSSTTECRTLQTAPNGKIYVGPASSSALSVINEPNMIGNNCNFQRNQQTLGTGSITFGLPSFLNDFTEACTPPLPRPVVSIQSSAGSSCIGENRLLTATGDTAIRWYNSSYQLVGTDSIFTVINNSLQPTTYYAISPNDTASITFHAITCLEDSICLNEKKSIAIQYNQQDASWYTASYQLIQDGNPFYPASNVLGSSVYYAIATIDTTRYTMYTISCYTPPVYQLPNIFTPNTDTKNTTFQAIVNQNITVFFLEIYNRWGNKVYETTDPAFQWNGYSNGTLCNDGTYFYAGEYQDANYKIYPLKGFFQLLK